MTTDKIIIKGLKTKCIIGDYEWERKRPQKIIFDLELEANLKALAENDKIEPGMLDYNVLARDILKMVTKSGYHLIETLAEAVADLCLSKFPVDAVLVRLYKPDAIKAADAAVVEIYRSTSP
ncbi:MAG: dihydroneopterin aldolase [Deltaproteobacteria bacterium]|nr:dihydroneopterin aldolase [Deltaproteobacteria bacterium]